ncbi:hypothetical protein DL96DRAFT_1585640 [Flagelloscypha sp. PMI_526]|nr:hypothetical protein DL96DRAFT_1585640 [Flagelloscypha sp. PMI_526]
MGVLGQKIYPLCLVLLLAAPSFVSTKVNYVDDNDSAWSFPKSPETAEWCVHSVAGNNCTGRDVNFERGNDGGQVDFNKAYSGTYHNGLAPSTATLSFRGSAIVIYGIQINASCALNCSINGQSQWATYEGSSRDASVAYNLPLCNITGLDESIDHILLMSLRYIDYGDPRVGGNAILIDYAVVATTDTVTTSSGAPSPSTSGEPLARGPTSKASTASIVGGALGAIIAVLLGVIVWMWRRHLRGKQPSAVAAVSNPPAFPVQQSTLSPTTNRSSPVSNRVVDTAIHKQSIGTDITRRKTSQIQPIGETTPPSSSDRAAQLEAEISQLRGQSMLPPSYR